MKKQRLLLSVRLTGINGERKIMSSESWIESFNNYMAGYIKEEIIRPFLQKEGFDENIINWLIDNFFECKFRGDFSNYLAWHEKIIMKEVKKLIKMDLTLRNFRWE